MKSKPEQFLQLLEPLKNQLLHYLISRTYNIEDARDLYQDTVLIAYQSFHQLRDRKAFPAWLKACARTAVAAKYRKKMNEEVPVDISSMPEEPRDTLYSNPHENEVVDEVLRRMDIEALKDRIAQLSFTERVFLHLRYEEDQSLGEIAEQLGTTPNYLGVLHHRLKKKLRKGGSDAAGEGHPRNA